MNRQTIRLARIAIATALYVALSLAIMPLTFGLVQIRFAEMLVLLCFFDRDYCYSMTLGCAITNFFSPLGIIDVFFGTLGTLIAVVLIRYTRRLYLAWIPPTLATALIALEYYITASEPFMLSWLTIMAGEVIAVGIVGIPIFYILSRNKRLMEIIGTDTRYDRIMESINRKKEQRQKSKPDSLYNNDNTTNDNDSDNNVSKE